MKRGSLFLVSEVLLSVFCLFSVTAQAQTVQAHANPQSYTAPARANYGSRDYHQVISVERQDRDFELHLPPSYDGTKALPVMYVLPGVSGDIGDMKAMTSMNSVADRKGFAVVYVEAQHKSFGIVSLRGWNLAHGALTDKAPGYDDLQYIRAVINIVGRQILIDRNAQYVVGHSEGGMAAQFVAQEIPVFAGFASVKSTRRVTDPWPTQGTNPMAALIILGRYDTTLSLSGGFGQDSNPFIVGAVPRMAESLPLWQKQVWTWANRCNQPRVSVNPYSQVTDYSCKDAPVREIITNTEHHWDGEYTSSVIADFLLSYRKSANGVTAAVPKT
jgi:poly(3-hydroxybutyrate) depolymerase